MPFRGKQKYQNTNVGLKSKLSRLLLQRITKFEMNEN